LSALPALFAKGSDRRLKEAIVRIGKLIDGLNVYTFNYIGESLKRIGLMADEVEVLYPKAVTVNNDGYKMVDYSLPSWLSYRR